jgi:hypothetical protein
MFITIIIPIINHYTLFTCLFNHDASIWRRQAVAELQMARRMLAEQAKVS